MTYVLLVDLTPPIGILLTITDEFLGIRALSSVYSGNKTTELSSYLEIWVSHSPQETENSNQTQILWEMNRKEH